MELEVSIDQQSAIYAALSIGTCIIIGLLIGIPVGLYIALRVAGK